MKSKITKMFMILKNTFCNKKVLFMPHNKSFIDQASLVKMAGNWPSSLYAFFMDRDEVEANILTELACSIIYTHHTTSKRRQTMKFKFINIAINLTISCLCIPSCQWL